MRWRAIHTCNTLIQLVLARWTVLFFGPGTDKEFTRCTTILVDCEEEVFDDRGRGEGRGEERPKTM